MNHIVIFDLYTPDATADARHGRNDFYFYAGQFVRDVWYTRAI